MPESLFTGRHVPKYNPKQGTWASMNTIQRVGLVGLFPFAVLSWVFQGELSTIFGVVGWTSILMGYVAGNLWRYRHALHYWWSLAFASIVHACLLPVFISLTALIRDAPSHSGRGYISVAFSLVIVETLTLLFVLKRTAIAIHRRMHPTWPNRPSGAI